MNIAAIFALVCWLVPPHYQTHNNETEKAARDRYLVISHAIHDVTRDDRLQLFLLTVARHETNYKQKHHSGDVQGDYGYAWGLFQLNLGSKRRDFEIPNTSYTLGDIVGTDAASTYRAVKVAADMLAPRIQKCGGQPYCVFRLYGGLSKDKIDKATHQRLLARVTTYRKIEAIKNIPP
jgi:hypothetical protein